VTDWVRILAATSLLQTASAFLTRIVPTLAPVLTAEAGIEPEFVGHLWAITILGTTLFIMFGAPYVRRSGPIRVLQIAGLFGSAGALFIDFPHWTTLALASLLIGIAYGPSPIAGNSVLDRHTPRRNRSLMFSIKQAGAPFGGALAGLVLPLLMGWVSWRLTIVIAAALAAIPVLLVQPLRQRIDAERDPQQSVSLRYVLSLANIAVPFRSLRLAPELPGLNIAAALLSVTQGVLFAFLVTYGVQELGLDLARAGLMFSVMQAVGIPGRILLGWICDRLGSATLTLHVVSWTAAATSIVLAVATPAWPLWALLTVSGLTGLTAASWMGIYLAEVARLVPTGTVGEAMAGSSLLPSAAYMAGPTLFAGLVALTGSYRLGFIVGGVIALAAVAALAAAQRRGTQSRRD